MPERKDWAGTTIEKVEIHRDGTAATLIFADILGNKLGVAIPLDAISELGRELTRTHLAARQATAIGAQPEMQGEFNQVALSNPRNVTVDVLLDELPAAVALVFDRDTTLQIGYVLDPEMAESIGKNLIEAGKHCRSLGLRQSH